MNGSLSEWIMTKDGTELYLRKWILEYKEPEAILQIAHGMAEYIGRYDDFAKFMVSKGIFVYGNDHRGHGKTGERAGVFGFFAEKNGFEIVTDDLLEVNKVIKEQYPNKPVFLLGHSLGSFLARRYIQKYGNTIQGVIFSGTAGNPGFMGKIGLKLAQWEIKKIGAREPSPFLNHLIFGNYNKGIKKSKTKFDWLSRDDKVVEEYVNDPWCGFICSASFFYDLLTGLKLIHDPIHIQSIPKDLPMYFFSGDRDPVGGFSRGVKRAIQQYIDYGIKHIDQKFYHLGRHEMLNEINREEVYTDVYQWLEKQILK